MGPLSSTDRPGLVAVDKYLLPNEVQVATVRRHPAVLIPSVILALAGLLIAGTLTVTVASSSHPAAYTIWAIEAILVLWLLWRLWNWRVDYFVVTSARLLLTSGVFTRDVAMVPINKITDLKFERSFPGRVFGYGDFIVETPAQKQSLERVDHIPYPEALYLLVCGMLFPEVLEPVEDDYDENDQGIDDNPLGPDDDNSGDNGPEPDDQDDGGGYDQAEDYRYDDEYPAESDQTLVAPAIVQEDPEGLFWLWRRGRRVRRIRRSRD
jgi:membrane protein YdbS with pleckstrin-like domain